MRKHISRSFGMIVAVLFTSAMLGLPAQAQTAAKPNVVKDGWIMLKIHSQFIPDHALEGSNIDVDTVGGAVTLNGTVPNEAARARAVQIAKMTDGVKSVTDKLRIGPAEPSLDTSKAKDAGAKAVRATTDGWIKSKIYAQFLTDWTVFEDSNINIDVAKGAVTLKGTVKSEAARAKAVALAKGTDGVKSVNDMLKVG